MEKIIGFLIKPAISGLLIMMIVGGIYFELQTPGIGFPLAIAILGALLYFFPHYAGGMVEYWEIVVFVIGFVLLLIEIFAIPGFGVFGILGITCIVGGLAFALIPNVGFRLDSQMLLNFFSALLIVIFSSTIALIVSIYAGKKLITTKSKHIRIALNESLNTSEGYSVADTKYTEMIGQTATAFTVLRPAGKILINGDVFDAETEGDWIEKGDAVKVVRYVNGQLIVRSC